MTIISPPKRLAIIESPFATNVMSSKFDHLVYLVRIMKHSIERGEAPIASHLIYPQVLDDEVPEQRRLGIDCGLAWSRVAELHAFYLDYGWSRGMLEALEFCKTNHKVYELRTLYPAAERKEPDTTQDRLALLLLEANRRYETMSPEQKKSMWAAQRKSWVVGEMLLSHPNMTREEASTIYDSIIGVTEMLP